jgi:hypothetical protein
VEPEVEEVRARWLQTHAANIHVVSFLRARSEKQDSPVILNEQYRLIYTFYLAHGFIPMHAWQSLVGVIASLN